MKAPSLPSLRSMILSMERKCFSVVVFFLFVFRGLYAPIFTHKVNWRFVFLIFFCGILRVLSAVSSFTHTTKTNNKKKQRRSFFYKHTDVREIVHGKRAWFGIWCAIAQWYICGDDSLSKNGQCYFVTRMKLYKKRNYSKVNDRFWERNQKNTHTENYA